MQQLEENFKASGGKFIKCKLEKLFKIKGNPQLNKESFTFSEKGIYPYFTRTVFNNGILGYVDYLDDEHKISGNTIAVGMLGMQFFYMEKDFYAGQFTKTLYPKISKFNESIALYFIGMLNKLQSLFQGVLVRDFEKTFYNTEIVIPQRNNQIDFDYIEERIRVLEEERIRVLEEERIRVLEAYLKVTGLDKYILTKEEQEAYDIIHNGGGIFKSYTIGSLFRVYSPKKRFNANTVKFGGKHPYVVRTSQNNGIRDYITEDEKYLSPANTFSFGQDTATVFYQEKKYFTGDKIKVMQAKDFEVNVENACYFISVIRKAFSYCVWGQDSFNETVLNDTNIYLPTNSNDEIDFELMEKYIRAIEKKVIKNVVDWKDEIIKKTKEVVG